MDKVQELREINDELNELKSPYGHLPQADSSSYRRGFLEGRAFEVTRGMTEHPEFWEHGCDCDLCRSYA